MTNTKFKPGDKVRCIRPDEDEYLVKGGVYTVTTVFDNGSVNLEEPYRGGSWMSSRFELIPDTITLTWPKDVAALISAAVAYILTRRNKDLSEDERQHLRIAYRDLQQALCKTKPGSDVSEIRVATDHGAKFDEDGIQSWFLPNEPKGSPLSYAWFVDKNQAARAYCTQHKLSY